MGRIAEDADVRSQMQEVLESIRDRLFRHGLDVSEVVLGDGQNGAAWLTEDNEVLKLTMDSAEAEAAMRVMQKNGGGKKFKHVVVVREVFQFKYGPDTYYGIVQEHLKRLSAIELDALKGAFNYFLQLYDNTANAAKVLSTRRPWHAVAADLIEKDGDRPGSLVDTFTEFQYPEMFSELRAMGVQFADFHPGNIMKRDNRTYVLIDLGASFTPGGRQPAPELTDAIDVALREAFTVEDGDGVGDPERHGHEYDSAELQRALKSIHPQERDSKLSTFGGWQNLRDNRSTVVDWFRSTTSGNRDEPYLDVGAKRPLFCRVFAADVSGFNSIAQGRSVNGEGFIVDAEVYFLDRDFEPTAFVWHNERRVATKEEAIRRVDRIRRYIDGKTVLQLASEPKAGPLRMSKFNESRLREAYEPDEYDLVVANAAQLLKKHGFLPDKFLGQGTNGKAYALPDGRALKVTEDEDEAKTSIALKGRELPNVVRIDDVFRFPALRSRFDAAARERTNASPAPMFGIVQERLQPLSGGELSELREVLNEVTLVMDFNTSKPLMAWIQGPVGRKLQDPAKVRRFQEMCQKYQIDAMFDQLRKAKVVFGDFHAKNIMKRQDGAYVITDLGNKSVAKGAGTPPVLERAVDMLTRDITEMLTGGLMREDDDKIASPNDPTRKFVQRPVAARPAEDDFSDLNEPEDSEMPDWGPVRGFSLNKPPLSQNIDRLARRGITVEKELGSGYNGTAFSMRDGRVLKVTRDELEAKSAYKLKGRNLRFVVKFYDVFAFPGDGTKSFGIVMERLRPLPDDVADEIDHAYAQIVHGFRDQETGGNNPFLELGWHGILSRVAGAPETGRQGIETFVRLKIPRILSELESKGIRWADCHGGNLMMRGNTIVAIDLGVSNTQGGGQPIPVLEEGKADRVALIYGRFQPPDRDSVEVIRKAARTHDKVVVALADSQRPTVDEPLSYDLRVAVLKASLPDFESKIETYRVTGGSLPDMVKEIYMGEDSTLEPKIATDVYVPTDVARAFRGQLASYKDDDGFDPSLFVVSPDQKLDGRLSKATLSGLMDRGVVAASDYDPHVVSSGRLEELEDRMRDETIAARRGGVQVESVFKPSVGGKTTATSAPSEHFDRGRADAVMDRVSEQLAARKGIVTTKLRYLGAGQMGAAYDMGDGRVLKVTTDESEAKTAFGLLGKQLKHVNTFHDVFKFPTDAGKTLGDTETYYGIIQDKLEPLEKEEARRYDEAMRAVFSMEKEDDPEGVVKSLATQGWDQFVIAFEAAITREVQTETQNTAFTPVVRKAVAKRMQYFRSIWEEYQMPEIVRDLRSMGVQFADFHSGNVMKRGDTYVINDLGKSKSPAQADPPMLETSSVLQAIVEVVVEDALSKLGPTTGFLGHSEDSGASRGFLAAGEPAKGSPDPADSPHEPLDRI